MIAANPISPLLKFGHKSLRAQVEIVGLVMEQVPDSDQKPTRNGDRSDAAASSPGNPVMDMLPVGVPANSRFGGFDHQPAQHRTTGFGNMTIERTIARLVLAGNQTGISSKFIG